MITIEGAKVLYKIECIKAAYKSVFYITSYYTSNYRYSIYYSYDNKIEYHKKEYLSITLELNSFFMFTSYYIIYTYD